MPRQYSSGGKQTLLGISKRGDTYLRTLLIHGARAAVAAAQRKQDARSRWITALAARRGANIAAVACLQEHADPLGAHGPRRRIPESGVRTHTNAFR